MNRIAAHLFYCSPNKIITNGVIELSDNGEVLSICSLNDCQSEPANTIFYNGILLPFLPEPSRWETDNLKEELKREFINNNSIEIAEGVNTHLWFMPNTIHDFKSQKEAIKILPIV